MPRQWVALAAAPASLPLAPSASAQELDNDLVVQPAIPQDFSRGRDVSVQEQSRPDYSALGLRLAGHALSSVTRTSLSAAMSFCAT